MPEIESTNHHAVASTDNDSECCERLSSCANSTCPSWIVTNKDSILNVLCVAPCLTLIIALFAVGFESGSGSGLCAKIPEAECRSYFGLSNAFVDYYDVFGNKLGCTGSQTCAVPASKEIDTMFLNQQKNFSVRNSSKYKQLFDALEHYGWGVHHTAGSNTSSSSSGGGGKSTSPISVDDRIWVAPPFTKALQPRLDVSRAASFCRYLPGRVNGQSIGAIMLKSVISAIVDIFFNLIIGLPCVRNAMAVVSFYLSCKCCGVSSCGAASAVTSCMNGVRQKMGCVPRRFWQMCCCLMCYDTTTMEEEADGGGARGGFHLDLEPDTTAPGPRRLRQSQASTAPGGGDDDDGSSSTALLGNNGVVSSSSFAASRRSWGGGKSWGHLSHRKRSTAALAHAGAAPSAASASSRYGSGVAAADNEREYGMPHHPQKKQQQRTGFYVDTVTPPTSYESLARGSASSSNRPSAAAAAACGADDDDDEQMNNNGAPNLLNTKSGLDYEGNGNYASAAAAAEDFDFERITARAQRAQQSEDQRLEISGWTDRAFVPSKLLVIKMIVLCITGVVGASISVTQENTSLWQRYNAWSACIFNNAVFGSWVDLSVLFFIFHIMKTDLVNLRVQPLWICALACVKSQYQYILLLVQPLSQNNCASKFFMRCPNARIGMRVSWVAFLAAYVTHAVPSFFIYFPFVLLFYVTMVLGAGVLCTVIGHFGDIYGEDIHAFYAAQAAAQQLPVAYGSVSPTHQHVAPGRCREIFVKARTFISRFLCAVIYSIVTIYAYTLVANWIALAYDDPETYLGGGSFGSYAQVIWDELSIRSLGCNALRLREDASHIKVVDKVFYMT